MRTQLILNSTPDGSAPETPITHRPVLLKEILEVLQINPSDTVLDCTLGSGGHSREIARLLSDSGRLIAIDLDAESILRANSVLKKTKSEAEAVLLEGNFADVKRIFKNFGLNSADKILLDLGWNQDQFEFSRRGFSFAKDEPLNMSYGLNPDFTAKEIVNEWSQETLEDILRGFGNERFARNIAQNIVLRRSMQEVNTTFDLIDIIKESIPARFRRGKKHFATKTFQALRIATNKELQILPESLDNLHDLLSANGRIAVITFHSAEDRIVKTVFKNWVKEGRGILINKRVITASKEELQINKRARSAKLRAYEKKNTE